MAEGRYAGCLQCTLYSVGEDSLGRSRHAAQLPGTPITGRSIRPVSSCLGGGKEPSAAAAYRNRPGVRWCWSRGRERGRQSRKWLESGKVVEHKGNL